MLEYEDTDNVVNSGRVSLLSSYYNNCFDNLKITTDSEDYYVTRVDDMDAAIKVSAGSTEEDGNGWYFSTISSFKNYNRTVSVGEEGDSFEFELEGTSYAIISALKEAVIEIENNIPELPKEDEEEDTP